MESIEKICYSKIKSWS